MSKFIVITSKWGSKVRINAAHIIAYWVDNENTLIIDTVDRNRITSTAETVEDIDRQLAE